LRYREAGRFASDPSQIIRDRGCGGGAYRTIDVALTVLPKTGFDYLWLIDVPPYDPKLVEHLEPVWRGKGSILYRFPS
jgi:hypothetical protein